MEEKELKTDIPLGYEIDREKSTFEKNYIQKSKKLPSKNMGRIP